MQPKAEQGHDINKAAQNMNAGAVNPLMQAFRARKEAEEPDWMKFVHSVGAVPATYLSASSIARG